MPVSLVVPEGHVPALMAFTVDSLRLPLIWRVLLVRLHLKINYKKKLPPKPQLMRQLN